MTLPAPSPDEEAVLDAISAEYDKQQIIDKYLPVNTRHRWTQSMARQSWPKQIARDLVAADLEQEFYELCSEMPSPAMYDEMRYQEWLDSIPKPYYTRRWHLLGVGFGPFVGKTEVPWRCYTRELREYEILLDEHRRRIESWCARLDLHHALIAHEDATERRDRCINAFKKTAYSQRKRPV